MRFLSGSYLVLTSFFSFANAQTNENRKDVQCTFFAKERYALLCPCRDFPFHTLHLTTNLTSTIYDIYTLLLLYERPRTHTISNLRKGKIFSVHFTYFPFHFHTENEKGTKTKGETELPTDQRESEKRIFISYTRIRNKLRKEQGKKNDFYFEDSLCTHKPFHTHSRTDDTNNTHNYCNAIPPMIRSDPKSSGVGMRESCATFNVPKDPVLGQNEIFKNI